MGDVESARPTVNIRKIPICGDNILLDATTRVARLKQCFPLNPALRLLFVQVEITQWLIMYPPPNEAEAPEAFKTWVQNSRFTTEERDAGIQSISIKSLSPIWAHAIVFDGKDVVNTNADLPVEWGPQRWQLVGASSVRTLQADREKYARITCSEKTDIVFCKNAIVGAILVAPCTQADGVNSRWLDNDYKHHCMILGSLRFKFNAYGPSGDFKDIDLHPEEDSPFQEQDGATKRVEAIRKKLIKFKFFTGTTYDYY